MNVNLDSALCKKQTTCINGLFVSLVFLSHFCQYVDVNSIPYFEFYLYIKKALGQLIVAPFLFYSGYGVMEQINVNGIDYILDMPVKRIFKTWLRFSIAVTIFLVVSLVLNYDYSIRRILLSYLAWESIGNSNWYIFAVLYLYTVTYISFRYMNQKYAIISVLFYTIIYIVGMYFFKNGSWWYDTVFSFIGGILFSYNKENIKKLFGNHFTLGLLMLTMLHLLIFYMRRSMLGYELLSVIFCVDLVLLLSLYKLENKVLYYLGGVNL